MKKTPTSPPNKNGFQDLRVWQLGQDLAVDVYSSFKNCNDFSFVDQIERAVVSISNNIAEGSERSTSVEFARFLDIAKGSCGEVRSMLILANKLDYLPKSQTDSKIELTYQISKQLASFAQYLRKQDS